ncbi:hypothetical protein EB796_006181 [Bugula neritina]|uniref:C-type lectin domain-containing protein n=1 Tax=Bugula neritina TaxID=10212 RepID=A0A7J7KA24_BUGNE|nr:hypothetical protein EB796_006181 [Bugula neritina]
MLRCNKHIQVLNISYTTRETKTITMRKSIACGLLLAAVIAVCFDLNDATCGHGVSCPSGYIYNPHSSTCYKIVTLSKKWDDAKAYCEGNGDRLAVFDSLESISWARQMRKNHSAWKGHINKYIWIGGRDYHGVWQWDGKLKKDIVVEDWYQSPHNLGGPKDCLGLFADSNDLKWDDGTCTSAEYFMCEKY